VSPESGYMEVKMHTFINLLNQGALKTLNML